MNKLRLASMVFVALLALTSCRKELAESIQSAADNAVVETEYAQIYDVVSDYASTDNRSGKTEDLILPSGATVIFNDTTFTDGDGIEFYIDYGPLDHGASFKGILCSDGRYRAGKIFVSMDKRWSDFPVTINVTIGGLPNEYYVGNGTKMYKVSGLKTITRNSATSYTVEVTNASFQRDNGTITWNSSRTVSQTYDAGSGWYNDEYTLSGTASGTNVNGVTFSVATVTPLKKKLTLGCLTTFIKGELLLTNSNGKVLGINYDSYNNEACDKAVTVTYNGNTNVIQVW
jgi:hypothetical protein